jgi:hypothetical protein
MAAAMRPNPSALCSIDRREKWPDLAAVRSIHGEKHRNISVDSPKCDRRFGTIVSRCASTLITVKFASK